MAKTRSSADDSADELNQAEADAIDSGQDPEPAVEAVSQDIAEEAVAEQAADAKDAADAATDASPDGPTEDPPAPAKPPSDWDEFKAWVRKELELVGLGHSADERDKLNP